MASEAQVVANRRNAEKSTGPRTPEGKATVAQNAVKHGFSGRQNVIQGEDQAQFELHREALLRELAPVGPMESILAERAVSLSWRLQRAERLQNEAFDALYLKETTGLAAKLAQALYPKRAESVPGDGDSAFGRAVLQGFSNDRVLERLLMYERRIEHSLFKTTAELQRLRLTRELDGPEQEPACSGPARATEGYPKRDSSRLGTQETPPGVTTSAPPTGASPPVEMSHRSNIPSFQDSIQVAGRPVADDALCKTNSIPSGPDDGQLPCGKAVMDDPSQRGPGKTNPISMTKGHAERTG